MPSHLLQQDRLDHLSHEGAEAVTAARWHQIGHILVVVAKGPREQSSKCLMVLKSICGQNGVGLNPGDFLVPI